jgi:predicted secreted hydrolase
MVSSFMHLSKRQLLKTAGYALLSSAAPYALALALPQRTLVFPRDYGAHPDFRTEWWYITGHAKNTAGREFGFQVTFFRSRVDAAQSMQSKFAAKQLIFAHCAITDVQGKKLWHDQRIAREGFGIAQASVDNTDIKLGNWSLKRTARIISASIDDYEATPIRYQAHIQAKDFAFDLSFTKTQAVLLQGNQGLSRKGPDEKQASYYYSVPQLQADGNITLQGDTLAIQGTAWLDQEWSQELLHPEAVGWDWIGMNLFDGSALTAFQLRRKDGSALWTGGSFRAPGPIVKPVVNLPINLANAAPTMGQTFNHLAGDVQFTGSKPWTSPANGAKYPTEWLVRTPTQTYTVKAVIPNQELSGNSATGTVYWEGLSDLFDSSGKHVGRGYLEMTGYAGALRI